VPVASGVGRASPVEDEEPSCTRKYWPGGIVPASEVRCQLVLDAVEYWTVQPVTSTAAEPRLNSSTKSFLSGQPPLPPPPKTWLTTTFEADEAKAGAARATASASTSSDVRRDIGGSQGSRTGRSTVA